MKNQIINGAQGHRPVALPCKSPEVPSAFPTRMATIVSCLVAIVVTAGCASTKVADRQQLETGRLARPGNIWVYDFISNAADVPADSAVTMQLKLTTPLTSILSRKGRGSKPPRENESPFSERN